jgi:hypothetical protein
MLPGLVRYQRPLVETGRVVQESSAPGTVRDASGAARCHYSNGRLSSTNDKQTTKTTETEINDC